MVSSTGKVQVKYVVKTKALICTFVVAYAYGGTFEIRCTSKFGATYLSRNFSCHAMLSAGISTAIHN